MFKKLEVLANVAVIITSLVLCAALTRTYLFQSAKQSATVAAAAPAIAPAVAPRKRAVQPGTQISLPGFDWSKSDRTLLMALSTKCHFCTESAPLYQQLIKERNSSIRFVAVFPQSSEESKKYLENIGVPLSDVLQASLDSIGVSGTPTLLLVDKNGELKDSWVGKLSKEAASSVINRIAKGE